MVLKSNEENMQSHSSNTPEFSRRLEDIKARLTQDGDTESGTLAEKLEILQQLTEFEYGRFLIQHGGINGRWSHYLFYEFPLLEAAGKKFHPLEYKMLTNKGMQSNRERIPLLQSLLVPDLTDGISILSVPCGVMAEVLTMDMSLLKNFRLVGVDLDESSVELARNFARERRLDTQVEFYQRDAWNLNFDGEFDRIVSLGLNMYCQNLESALNLYRSFHRTLKANGKLMVSYLTPTSGPDCERDLKQLSSEEKRLIPLISEILQIKYVNHLNSSAQIVENLKMAGFKSITCHYSSYRALNIAVAIK